ncbi:hypothetical protein NPIL_564211 [Nephila pilipes]|uniref:Uncharacterized protein n=1 Tax=Nephila pilipes TaxID=299642 RepID=A0A8X6U696_NEPPI|nr:hypothetical protein NPIL_564211 [Nephila pilipes]
MPVSATAQTNGWSASLSADNEGARIRNPGRLIFVKKKNWRASAEKEQQPPSETVGRERRKCKTPSIDPEGWRPSDRRRDDDAALLPHYLMH